MRSFEKCEYSSGQVVVEQGEEALGAGSGFRVQGLQLLDSSCTCNIRPYKNNRVILRNQYC